MEGMLSPWEPLRPSVMELGFKLWENPNLTGSGCEGATGVAPGRALEDLQFSQCQCGAGPGPLVLNSCLVLLHLARGQSKPSPAPLTCLAPAPYPGFIPQPRFPGSGLEQNLWLRDSIPRFHPGSCTLVTKPCCHGKYLDTGEQGAGSPGCQGWNPPPSEHPDGCPGSLQSFTTQIPLFLFFFPSREIPSFPPTPPPRGGDFLMSGGCR